MIAQLTGTLLEVLPSRVVLDVGGVGFEMGVSSTTASSLPQVGEAGVTLLTRLVVREDAMELYGFSSREERALFDKLRAISGVGPKLALSVLSTFTPEGLSSVVVSQDAGEMARVPGVGKKKASRLLVELSDVFARDPELLGLAATAPATASGPSTPGAAGTLADETTEALLAMGFTPQEAELAIKGLDEAGATTIEAAVSFALRRLGRGA
ncbi:MAG: Holliday junction branch migration protein RuvA [Atopobiaceae bacterium]|uniref:Holliday junction branch migration complex subunit RuvA n=1 Tax=Olsenella absiana TaxID=3115222 RepID=A0ABU7R7F7_9ACTN|nr:Holliday junction branch migration protein RuvA [Olsenella sp.]MDY3901655.1 Holliday junction branch migration protein RuvA [Atopobiaceae bacterium]